jgi:F-type H+-transporting ATPase subunit gamma
MPGTREIRNKIKSVKNTQKITKAMEMVAASKMRKTQERMRASRPYAGRMLSLILNLAHANAEYKHPFMVRREKVKRVAVIVVTSDKGLCGALNTNILRMVVAKAREWESQGVEMDFCAIGGKAFAFLTRMKANIVSHVVALGDTPHLEKLIGVVKVVIDAYLEGRVDEIHVFGNRFINTMTQEPSGLALIPFPTSFRTVQGEVVESQTGEGNWDYLYEPDAQTMLDFLMVRYVESLVYQLVVENMASEQAARMVAMKSASDNAGSVITELTLVYNKARQAGITKEIAEIVGGAAAV